MHGNKFDYSKSIYNKMNCKIEIICHIHGSFFQEPRAHLRGQGCPVCGSILTGLSVKSSTEGFIEKAELIHDKIYDYSKVKYIGALNHIIIICPKHGEFIQAPHNHLSGWGCHKCSKSSISRAENEWLDYLNIPKNYRQTLIKVDQIQYFADAFDPITNTIYEYYGDYWHGNPKVFDQEKINKVKCKTFGQLYRQTIDRENTLKNAGYNIISIWESDWGKSKELKKTY